MVRAQLRMSSSEMLGAHEKIEGLSKIFRGIYGPKLSLEKFSPADAKEVSAKFFPKINFIKRENKRLSEKYRSPEYR